MLVYLREELEIGFTFFDISILEFYVGNIKIEKGSRFEELISKFKSLIVQLKPIECVTLHAESSKQSVKLLKTLNQAPLISYLT